MTDDQPAVGGPDGPAPDEAAPEAAAAGDAPIGDSAPEIPAQEDSAQEDPALDDAALGAALEAILLVVDEPVGEITLAQTIEQPVERVAARLKALAAEYTAAGRGFDLRRAAGGWRLYTRPEQAPYVERFVLDGQQSRLTQAALETLAVVAYKQPVTRSRVAAIRGVNCDGVIRTLLTRGLVEEAGSESETGAHLYRTTSVFLEKLGLDSVDQLPPLAPFLPEDTSAWDPDVRAEVALPPRRPDRGAPAEPATNGSQPLGAPPAAEPPAEEPTAAAADGSATEELPADGSPAEEWRADGPPAEEPTADQPPTEEPRGEAPGSRDVLA